MLFLGIDIENLFINESCSTPLSTLLVDPNCQCCHIHSLFLHCILLRLTEDDIKNCEITKHSVSVSYKKYHAL